MSQVVGNRTAPLGAWEENVAGATCFRNRLQVAQQLYQEAGMMSSASSSATLIGNSNDACTPCQDSDSVISDRMSRAKAEIGHWDGYDYVLINDDVQACFEKVRQILSAERMKRRRQKGLIGFVRDLAAT